METKNSHFQEETRNNQKNTATFIKDLEVQMDHIKQQIVGTQAQRSLPSETMTNPREHNNVSVVVLRSGKSTESLGDKYGEENHLLEVDLEIKENQKIDEEEVTQKVVEKEKPIDPKPTIKLPYPSRKKKKDHHKNFFEKFLEMFKKVEINIPFSEALEQMPIYSKFMKDIISKKRTMDTEPILLTETCSAILKGMKIPVKKKDRGYLTIPCKIGDIKFKKALINLGASVSLMPLSNYKKLGIGTVQDTRISLQFTDYSVKRPYGIVEDVMVKIDKFVFLIDFVILEMPEDEEIP
ncbi:uncharacterized protein LOC127137955 [Lathyrus oleraceus]|uniref:uncharacterized protein LOC127137955 n=1 Tax=Pisum sativum TaxID=3888 RepID=UPI0021D16502|nr:uncharacterized protein LOC127137955 [Pisum sativum]